MTNEKLNTLSFDKFETVTDEELMNTSGGVAFPYGAVAVFVGVFTLGYNIGKDLAKR